MSIQPPPNTKLTDYKAHYRADADAIVDPQALEPLRRASEMRRLETLVHLLNLQRGERVLDLGCGSGWLTDRCSRQGAKVCAMDIGFGGVAGAMARFPDAGSYQVGDLYYLPYAASHFDVAVLSEVVEHLDDIESAFAEARRVLRPGGRLLVSVPYRETIVDHLCIHCNRLTPANAHLHRFDEEKLATFFERSGFAVTHVRLMSNKVLELAGFPRWSARWPDALWRLADAACNRIVPKPAFLCITGVKGD
jgi:ubiquinone/menaquinone biosynthesis C-methylase UbiE